MIGILFPFQTELAAFLDGSEEIRPEAAGPLRLNIPARRPGWRLAVCGQGKVEAALAGQILADHLAPEALLLIGSATALDPALAVGDLVLADPCIEWDFGGAPAPGAGGRPTFRCAAPFPDALLNAGPVLSGDCDVFDPARKARLREEHGALALAWEGAGFHRCLRRNHLPGWEIRVITETAGEGRPSLDTLRTRLAEHMPQVRALLEGVFG